MSKHLLEAKKKGAAAGLAALQEFVFESPLGSANPKMDGIREALDGLSHAKAVGWYCETYGVPKASKAKGTTKARKTKSAIITGEEAWLAAGGGEKYEPNDERKAMPASNGLLYHLNLKGLLNL